VTGDQAADVVEMEPVDVLVHGDALEHAADPDVFRQRQLDQDAVDAVVGIELVDLRQQPGLGDGLG
jgi:hypothetical protein